MNFQSMEYFVAIAEERSFTRAAERLHVTQQSLSSHIATIEAELGCQLLVRHIPLELTYAGKVFLGYALQQQNALSAMRHEFNDITNNQKGELRVGLAYSRSQSIMPDLIARFQAKWPNIQIILHEGYDLTKILLDGDLDLVISNIHSSSPDIQYTDFYEENTILIISKTLLRQLSIEVEEIKEQIRNGHLSLLKDCPFILSEISGTASQTASKLFQQSNFYPKVPVQATYTNTILGLCIRNIGACFLSENLARAVLSPQNLEHLELLQLPEEYRYPIRFSFLKRAYQWNMISEFINIAKETYPKMNDKAYIWQ